MTLEEQLAETEKTRARTEENKRRQQFGLASVEVEAINKVRELADALQDKQASERMHKIIDVVEFIENAKTQLQQFKKDVKTFEDSQVQFTNDLASRIGKLENELYGLSKLLKDEAEKNRKMRDRETDTLDKLNQYLDQWL